MVTPLKIFYSWQSDLPEKRGRFFVQDVLERAIKALNRDYVIDEPERDSVQKERIVLDHDTKGVSGIPDLAATIFDKIAQSDVFVADVSFIARNDDNERLLPNPNVLIELGYALGKLGSDKIILVMDTERGGGESLPFDLRHKRHPIGFSSNSELAEERKQLTTKLAAALKPFVAFHCPVEARQTLAEHPSHQNILECIMNSDSKDDWYHTRTSDWTDIAFFKQDVNLRFEIYYNEDGTQNEDFKAVWANRFPDQHARGYFVFLRFCNTLIDTYILVSVDGGRAFLPIPKLGTLQVTPMNFKIAQIFDKGGSLMDYFFRSGLTLFYGAASENEDASEEEEDVE